MRIVVNGEDTVVDSDGVEALLTRIGAPSEGVAVAVNGEVVPRRERATRPLREGDRVEVIRAVGGG